MHKVTKVVAGLIFDRAKLLIAQRHDKNDHPSKWEFPGGKILSDEELKEALHREIKEELSITISNPKYLIDYKFAYSEGKNVHLYFYKITNFHGEINKNIHKDIKWISINELKEYDFLAGDKQIIDYIISNDINS